MYELPTYAWHIFLYLVLNFILKNWVRLWYSLTVPLPYCTFSSDFQACLLTWSLFKKVRIWWQYTDPRWWIDSSKNKLQMSSMETGRSPIRVSNPGPEMSVHYSLWETCLALSCTNMSLVFVYLCLGEIKYLIAPLSLWVPYFWFSCINHTTSIFIHLY